ncbi:hypothetical protein [Amycolatopsis magusensis]|uniref:hypothetical protein n=1 Tax=Amycolatopsis magusensis TaxID=882444 RepID=UPI0024A7FBC5|nr:hypothetical protein [Amycolatopsis magusensis]MDI5978225.1 hypothetical protein [Amycolatopsis magusensis]
MEQFVTPTAAEQAHLRRTLKVCKPPGVRPALLQQIEEIVRLHRRVRRDVLYDAVAERYHAADVGFR